MIHYTNIHNNFSVPDTLENGSITNESGTVKRSSKVFFIKDAEICREIFNIIDYTTLINLTDIEPLQYSEYCNGSISVRFISVV